MVGKGKFALIAIAMSLLISVSFAQQSHPLNQIIPNGLPSDVPIRDSHLDLNTWNIIDVTQLHVNTILKSDGLGTRTISLLEVGSNLFGLTLGTGGLTCTACIDLADMATGSVNSDKIVDGSIVNGDVSDSAGIAWGKLSGYPSVTGTGGLTGGGAISSSQSLSIATGGVTSTHIAEGAIVDGDISGLAGIAKSKISTTGTWAVADIPGLPTSKITSGSFSDSFIASASTWNNKAGTGGCLNAGEFVKTTTTGGVTCATPTSTYTWNIDSADDGGGSSQIDSGEIVTVDGSGSISTSLSGNTLTITMTGGDQNKLAKWSSTSALTTSTISESGTTVNIGNQDLTGIQTLTVSGTSNIGLNRVTSTGCSTNPCTLSCSSGEKLVGGGCSTDGTALTSNRPTSDTTWHCGRSGGTIIDVSILCARVD